MASTPVWISLSQVDERNFEIDILLLIVLGKCIYLDM